jgi:hypothetical protein
MAALGYTLVTGKEGPDLADIASEVMILSWPEFMLHDPVANQHWGNLYHRFPEFQFALVQPGTEDVVAVGASIPLAWDGHPRDLPDEGWDWALAQGFKDDAAGRTPKVQCALAITIPKPHRGKGLSAYAVRTMKAIGEANGLDRLLVPARPILKSRYPLTPMERYVQWCNDQGQPFDPWMRVHTRLGAEIVKVCPRSMCITGTVADWEGWTGMCFPESGTYIVPEALVPVEIDRDTDQGTYVEPNVWMWHSRPRLP